jgi:hypothetical protein
MKCTSRLRRSSLARRSAGSLGDLFLEIYQAVCGGQLRLAVIGVRALIEQVMIHKVGDNGSFVKNLDAFQKIHFPSSARRFERYS